MKKLIRFTSLLILLIISVSFLSSCSFFPSNEQADVEPVQPKLLVYDLLLGYRLDLQQSSTSFAGNLQQAQLVVKNDWHSALAFKYKVIWYDSDGLEIEPDASPWHPITLNPQANQIIQAIAPNTSAKDFMIHVKE